MGAAIDYETIGFTMENLRNRQFSRIIKDDRTKLKQNCCNAFFNNKEDREILYGITRIEIGIQMRCCHWFVDIRLRRRLSVLCYHSSPTPASGSATNC